MFKACRDNYRAQEGHVALKRGNKWKDFHWNMHLAASLNLFSASKKEIIIIQEVPYTTQGRNNFHFSKPDVCLTQICAFLWFNFASWGGHTLDKVKELFSSFCFLSVNQFHPSTHAHFDIMINKQIWVCNICLQILYTPLFPTQNDPTQSQERRLRASAIIRFLPDSFLALFLKSWPPYTPQGPVLAAATKAAKNRRRWRSAEIDRCYRDSDLRYSKASLGRTALRSIKWERESAEKAARGAANGERESARLCAGIRLTIRCEQESRVIVCLAGCNWSRGGKSRRKRFRTTSTNMSKGVITFQAVIPQI